MALQVDGYSSPIQVSTEEISLGGCFIETMFTFAVGANLVATFWIGRTKLSVKGVVATNFPQVGNGIEFKDMDRDGQETLRLFLAASGEQPV